MVEFRACIILVERSLFNLKTKEIRCFDKTQQIRPIKFPYLSHVIQRRSGNENFDNEAKYESLSALISQFRSREVNTAIWLVAFCACIILVERLLFSLETKEIRCFEKNSTNQNTVIRSCEWDQVWSILSLDLNTAILLANFFAGWIFI